MVRHLMTIGWLALALATGCGGECDQPRSWLPDGDGDGFGAGEAVRACSRPVGHARLGGDCDDEDPRVSPGARELCNGADDDCDGAADEGLDTRVWYADVDGDGYGDPLTGQASCAPLPDAVANALDCDDEDADVHPGAVEECNGHDDDCDGHSDGGEAVDAPTWYLDDDGDDFGDPTTAVRSCSAPDDHVADGTDCDDGSALAYPGGDEVCDGLDNDCDGHVDGWDAADAVVWHEDADHDGFGSPDAFVVTCTEPYGHVDDATDCDDDDPGVSPDATETCNGVDDDCDGEVDEDDAEDAPTWYLDLDGDGYAGELATWVSCEAPEGALAEALDCDDDDPELSPDVAEVCNAIDDDCDGWIDDDVCACDVTWYGGHAYQLCHDALSWSDAQAACTADGYDLVTVEDAAEDAWLTTLVEGGVAGWWIGLSDAAVEGTWVWASGSASTWTNWNTGEPNDSGGEDCTQLIASSGKWNDARCSSTTSYLCEAW